MCRHLPCPHPHPLPELFLVNCVGEGDMLLTSNEAPSLLIQKSDRKLLGHSIQNDQDPWALLIRWFLWVCRYRHTELVWAVVVLDLC